MSKFKMVIWIVFYLVLGYCVAVPYFFLAGGASAQQLFVIGVFAPLFVLFIASAYLLAFKRPRPGLESMAKKVFFFFLVYTFLPIMMNVISIFLGLIGLESLSESFFALRFWMFLLVPLGMLALLILFSFLVFLRQFVRDVRS